MEKRIISFLLFFFLSLNIVFAEEIDLNLKSERYILYNLNDNTVLLERDANSKTNIASLTKIMSTIVSIENVTDYDKEITITKEMISGIASDVSKVGLKKGQKVTYDDLVAGSLIASGADSIQALSIYSNGSLSNTVARMNSKAEELGLKNTNFTNVVGLYNEFNYSSANDMAIILEYALKNEKFKTIFTADTYTMSNGKKLTSTIARYNKKAKKDISYIKGSKTGYIKKAGYCLASIATINDVDYLLVTLNAYNDNTAHLNDSIKIYDYFSNNYSYIDIFNEGDAIYKLETHNTIEDEYVVKAPHTKTLYLKNDFDKEKLVYEYDGDTILSYLNRKGSTIGHMVVKYDDKVLDEFDVILEEKLSFSLDKYFVKYKVIIISFVVLVAILIVSLIVGYKIKKKNIS